MHLRLAEDQQQILPEEKALQVTENGGANLPLHEKIALDFAELLIRDPDSISDALFAEMKQHYTESEIIELCHFALNYYKNHAFNTSILLEPEDGDNIVMTNRGSAAKPAASGARPEEGVDSPDARFLA